ncbi:DNA-binding protein [Bacillus sp. VT 712]|uniref:GyrI-like domain-containing protein n=1 Tax=Bacillaceae TaxID=186817 RepID=UPI000473F973|nr:MULTISPECIES: GyrI-like domain-containing protein [Bacillaceae]KZB93468.1 DNA-binding protein [Bacillus sp. VT 712]
MLANVVVDQRKAYIDELTVVGVPIRTTDRAEEKGTGTIPAHWDMFYKQQMANKIANKVTGKMFALYTDYEASNPIEFTFALGYEVTPGGELREEMREFTIPAGEYMVFTTAIGPAKKVVLDAWSYIWEWSNRNERAFVLDFELYDERCIDPNFSQVDIYVSIKS